MSLDPQTFSDWDEATTYVKSFAQRSGFRFMIKERAFFDTNQIYLSKLRYICTENSRIQCPCFVHLQYRKELGFITFISSNFQHNHSLESISDLETMEQRRRSFELQKQEIYLYSKTSLSAKEVRQVLKAKYDEPHLRSYRDVYRILSTARYEARVQATNLISAADSAREFNFDVLMQAAQDYIYRHKQSAERFDIAKEQLTKLVDELTEVTPDRIQRHDHGIR